MSCQQFIPNKVRDLLGCLGLLCLHVGHVSGQGNLIFIDLKYAKKISKKEIGKILKLKLNLNCKLRSLHVLICVVWRYIIVLVRSFAHQLARPTDWMTA